MRQSGPVSWRQAVLIATWLAGTLLATGAVYAAVSAVAGEVTDQGPAPISQAGIEHALDQSPRSEPSATAAATPQTPSPAPSPVVESTPTPVGGGGGTHPTNPPPTAAPPANRTFALVGGTANVACGGGQVALNWATPNPGFQVDTGSSNGGSVIEVRFRSDTHESELQAWCSNGQIQGNVQEQSS